MSSDYTESVMYDRTRKTRITRRIECNMTTNLLSSLLDDCDDIDVTL